MCKYCLRNCYTRKSILLTWHIHVQWRKRLLSCSEKRSLGTICHRTDKNYDQSEQFTLLLFKRWVIRMFVVVGYDFVPMPTDELKDMHCRRFLTLRTHQFVSKTIRYSTTFRQTLIWYIRFRLNIHIGDAANEGNQTFGHTFCDSQRKDRDSGKKKERLTKEKERMWRSNGEREKTRRPWHSLQWGNLQYNKQ